MHQSLSGLFLPLSASPARPRRTFGYTVGWPLSARGSRRFPFCCYRTPGFRRIPFPFSFFFLPGLPPELPLSFFPVVSAISLTGLPNQGSAWFPPFCGGSIPLQWSPDLEDPVRLDKLSLVLLFFRSTKGASFPFKVGCSRKQALAC